MAFERSWPAVAPQLFTSNGTSTGVVTVADTRGFKVKQIAVLVANGVNQQVEIKRVLSPTQLIVGRVGKPINDRLDISSFTVAAGSYIQAEEQKKAELTKADQDYATYDQEPTAARRAVLVDQLGRYYEQANPIPVQLSGGSVFIEHVNNNVSVFISHKDNDPNGGDVHDSVRIGDGVTEVQNNFGALANAFRVAAQLGNANGSADWNAGISTNQTLRVSANITRNGTELAYNIGTPDANTLRIAAILANGNGQVDYGHGAVGAQTQRVAAILSNETAKADFNAGVTGANTLRVAAQLHDAQGNALTNTLSGSKRRQDTHIDGIYNATNNADPANVGLVAQERNAAAADSRQTMLPTAKRGTNDTDQVSLDVSLHDRNGDGIDSTLINGKRRLDVNLAAGGPAGGPAPALVDTVGGVDVANILRPLLVASSGAATVAAIGQSSFSPDPKAVWGDPTELTVDSSNQLLTRSTVFTDEGSLRDDFPGTSLAHGITGTLNFTNGSDIVTGTGTAFTADLIFGCYIKKTTDNETFYVRIASIDSDTQLTLETPYQGATGSGSAVCSNFYTQTPAGGSVSVNNSILTLNPGTAIGKVRIARQGDYLPYILNFYTRISQRIANQTTTIGFRDKLDSPEARATLRFAGTNNTQVIFRTSSSSNTADIEESTVTLPAGLTTASYILWSIEVLGNKCVLSANGGPIAIHKLHIPGPYDTLQIFAEVENSAVVTSTNLDIDFLYFSNVDRVGISNDFLGDAIAVTNRPATYRRVAASETVTLKNSPGVLKKVVINRKGNGSATITIHDGPTTASPIVAVIDTVAAVGATLEYDLVLENGLTYVSNNNTHDVTVIYE